MGVFWGGEEVQNWLINSLHYSTQLTLETSLRLQESFSDSLEKGTLSWFFLSAWKQSSLCWVIDVIMSLAWVPNTIKCILGNWGRSAQKLPSLCFKSPNNS